MSAEEIARKVNQYKDPELKVLITLNLIGEEVDQDRLNTLLALENK